MGAYTVELTKESFEGAVKKDGIVLVDSGGICSPDISRLKFRKLRRPIWPLDGVNDPLTAQRT